jgi:hypothetical protein
MKQKDIDESLIFLSGIGILTHIPDDRGKTRDRFGFTSKAMYSMGKNLALLIERDQKKTLTRRALEGSACTITLLEFSQGQSVQINTIRKAVTMMVSLKHLIEATRSLSH